MWHIGCGVKEFVDAMTTVTAHHRKSISLCMFLNDVPQLPISYTRLHCKNMTQHIPLASCSAALTSRGLKAYVKQNSRLINTKIQLYTLRHFFF